MIRVRAVYLLGVVLVSLCGFFSPLWWLGFLPLGAGLIWAAYDLIDAEDADAQPSRTSPR
jgi:hypothetical protein